jgi:hypothetical protein
MDNEAIENLRVKCPEIPNHILLNLIISDRLDEYINSNYCIILEDVNSSANIEIKGFEKREELVNYLITEVVLNKDKWKVENVYQKTKPIKYTINFSVNLEEIEEDGN